MKLDHVLVRRSTFFLPRAPLHEPHHRRPWSQRTNLEQLVRARANCRPCLPHAGGVYVGDANVVDVLRLPSVAGGPESGELDQMLVAHVELNHVIRGHPAIVAPAREEATWNPSN